MKKRTMRNFDLSCLTPVEPLSPVQIVAIRESEKASQATFAFHLGVPVTLVSQWERGEKKPSGPSLKLLTLVKKNGLDYVA
jgi:putative transcriptional regulator